jgi:hypothetical protein
MPFTPVERRREPRQSLQLPVRVKAFANDGQAWEERTLSQDSSAGGLSFHLQGSVSRGQVVFLELPLPRRLRQYDPDSPAYGVYAIVRDVAWSEAAARVGVMFFGKTPPRAFERNPTACFLLPSDLPPGGSSPQPPAVARPRPPAAPAPADDGPGRRQAPRFELFVNFRLQQLDGRGLVLREELTVAENLGLGGVRVRTTLDCAQGDILTLRELGGTFESRVEVRDAWLGPDGVRRLNLKFLGGRTAEPLLGKG